MATLSWKLHQVCTRHWLVRHCRPLGLQCVTRIRPEASVECTTVPHVGHACEYVQHCEPLFFFRGRRQGRQPLNIIMNMRVWLGNWSKKHGDQLAKYWTFDEFWFRKFRKTWFHRTYPKIDVHFFKFMAPKKTPNGYRQERRFADVQILWFVKQNGDFTTKWTGACGSGSSVGLGGGSLAKSYRNYFIAKQ